MDVSGVAVVVGAASGIGLETALLFAEKGARAVVFADVNYEGARFEAEKSKSIASAKDFQALAVAVDVTKLDSVEQMAQQTKSKFGRIDYFVNSAGVPRQNGKPITEVDIEEFDQLHNVNCKGVLICLKVILGVMKDQEEAFVEGRSGRRSIGRGSIVNVVSLSGLQGHPNSVTYTTSKFGANAVSRTAAMEFGAKGIRVNSLCPGFTDTPMLRKGYEQVPGLKEAVIKAMPLKRVATPEEIGETALFLASPGASFINGHVMVVDAGVSLSSRS